MSPEQLITALQWRYATKSFDPKRKIDNATWDALEDALVLTPSSYGLQPWKFFVVNDRAIRESLVEHSWGQRQVADASHLVVIAVKRRISADDVDAHLAQAAETHGIDLEAMDGLKGMVLKHVVDGMDENQALQWAKLQSYIALGNFMTCAAVLGVDACPMEGFSVPDYDRILGFEEMELTTSVLCPAGYRDPDDSYAAKSKVRFSKDRVVEHIGGRSEPCE